MVVDFATVITDVFLAFRMGNQRQGFHMLVSQRKTHQLWRPRKPEKLPL